MLTEQDIIGMFAYVNSKMRSVSLGEVLKQPKTYIDSLLTPSPLYGMTMCQSKIKGKQSHSYKKCYENREYFLSS